MQALNSEVSRSWHAGKTLLTTTLFSLRVNLTRWNLMFRFVQADRNSARINGTLNKCTLLV